MPTVDQLDAAPAATDADELIASQSGILRRVTRAQLLASVQPQITLPSGTLLGRASRPGSAHRRRSASAPASSSPAAPWPSSPRPPPLWPGWTPPPPS